MPNDTHRPDVAVFIDFENVYVSVRDKLDSNPNFEMIMDRCEDFGRVVIARAYADWYRYPRVTSALYANAIEPMYVPTYYYDRDLGRTGRAIKNSVDMNLCIDAMKTLYTNTNIAKFVLATGDRDFIPLVNNIRQQGKEVIIIGIGGAASAHLAQSADEFIFYESLVGKKPTDLQADLPKAKMPEKGRESEFSEEETERGRGRERGERERAPERERGERERAPERERGERERAPERAPVPERAPEQEAEPTGQPDIYDTLVNAINLARERGYVCSFGSLKLLMKELMGGEFKEGRYKDASGRPFAKFKDFVIEAERRGKVQVFTRGTVNEVFLPGEDPFKLSQFAQEITEEPGAPLLGVSEAEVQPETRPSVVTNGRRRRRRSRGGQQRTGSPAQNGATPLDDEDELFEESGAEEASGEEQLPDLSGDESSEEVFEELRERAEAEADQIEAITAFDPAGEELMPPDSLQEAPEAPAAQHASEPPSQAAELPFASSDGDSEQAPAAEPVAAQPFTDSEWQVLRETVGAFDRPISFAQIHDALRNMRNSAGIVRTNEELRSLIKQAINTGVLERLGKGNRASYRLAQPADTAELDLAGGDTSGSAEQFAPIAGDQAEQPIALPELALPELGTQPAEDPAPKRPRQRRKAVAPVTEPAAETPATPAKQPARRSRKAAAAPADAAPEAAAAEPAAPKRSRRKKPADNE